MPDKNVPITPVDQEKYIQFDPVKRLNFRLDDNGKRIYDECPAGFEFDDAGFLHPLILKVSPPQAPKDKPADNPKSD